MRSIALPLLALVSFGCASPSPAETPPPGLDPIWAREMRAGLDALELGRPEAAERRFQRALDVARETELPSDELAFSLYYLADAIGRSHPRDRMRADRAESLFEEARVELERAYGPAHPVLMPVYERLAALRTRAGDKRGAAALRTAGDRIAARFFPQHHFLRERFGGASPAAILQPLQVLQLLATAEASTDESVAAR